MRNTGTVWGAGFRAILAAAATAVAVSAQAASSGSGSAYGLNVAASVFLGPVVNVGPLATTGNQSAPPDFNVSQTTASANVTAGVLIVDAGVLTGNTQSTIIQNVANSGAQVDNLAVSIPALLALGATTVASTASTACVGGFPTTSGTTTVVGGTGVLSGITLPAPNTLVTLAGVANIFLNEQIVSGNSLTVNAIRIEINVVGAVTASVIVAQSRASIADCRPTVTVDVAPVINIANQTSYTVSGACSAGSGNVSVTLPGATSSPQSVPCSLGGTWTATFDATGVAQGPVTITATQTDGNGNTGTGTRDTFKDTIAPVVTVTAAPVINFGNQASYTGVTGTCSENGLPVTVSIGSVNTTPSPTCTANAWTAPAANVSALPDGVVVVTAAQTDLAGNTGSGTRNTSKDATAPVVTVTTAPPINIANQASYNGVSGTCSESGLPVSVSVGSVAVSPSPTCTAGAWTAAAVNATPLPDGVVTVTASQTDVAGNTGSGTRNTIKDVTAPVVTVTTAPPINIANQASYTGVTGTCSENGLPVTVSIGSVSATPSPTCTANAWTAPATNVSSVPDGVVVVTASQTDIAGNTGSGTRNTNKDATAPLVTVTTAPPINATNQASYTGVTGTCSENGLPVSVTVGGIAVAPSPTCTAGAWTAAAVNVTALPEGTVTVAASQTDAAGNTGSGTRNTIKDLTAPVVTVTAAPVINFGNQASYTGVTGTCSENGLPVTVSIGSVNATPSPTCMANAWTAPAANVSALLDGVAVVTASQTDIAGNTGSGTRNTNKDTIAPVVTVTAAPVINFGNQASYTGVTGTCSENGLPVTVSIGSVNTTPSPTCTANAWTAPAANVSALPDGVVVVTAAQTDLAGNTGSGTRNTSKDATAPVVTVTTAPLITSANQTNYTGVTGTCSENGLPVTVNVGGVLVSPPPTCISVTWTASAVNVTSLPDGVVTVTASQTDVAGNTGSGTRSTSKNITAALFSISGLVLHDINGLTDGVMGGSSPNLAGLYVYAEDSGGAVSGSTAVALNGSFAVANLPAGTYRIILSAVPGQLVNATSGLPTPWVSVGDGSTGTGDGTPDGVLANVVIGSANITGISFAIEMRPFGQSRVVSAVNFGGVLQTPVPGAAFTSGAGDMDGTVTGFYLTAFPSGADSIRIGATQYTASTFPVSGAFVALAGINDVTVDPAGSDTRPLTVALDYQVVDNANIRSSSTYTVALQVRAPAAELGVVPVPAVSPIWVALLLLVVVAVQLRRRA